jgi:DNA-binding MarR family transcriptional regulator
MGARHDQKKPRDLILSAFSTIFPAYLASSARLLNAARHHFDGDLDSMFILCVILASEDSSAWREAEFDTLDTLPRMGATNTSSIAFATGIPRATVQRKLSDLVARGWVERRRLTGWTVTPKGAQDLRGLSIEALRYLEALTTALRKSQEPQGEQVHPTRGGHDPA